MKVKRLDPQLRHKMKDLLAAHLGRCAESRSLTARIDFPIYHGGSKFGAPVFTLTPPDQSPSPVVFGIIGINHPESHVASEATLHLLELLAEQPPTSGGATFKILPILNPIALELDEDAPDIDESPFLSHIVSGFHGLAKNGLIEITSSSGDKCLIEGEVSPLILKAINLARSGGFPDTNPSSGPRIFLKRTGAEQRWNLRITLPETWSETLEVAEIARFIARFLEIHTESLATTPQLRRI